jgi:hypothetical protein
MRNHRADGQREKRPDIYSFLIALELNSGCNGVCNVPQEAHWKGPEAHWKGSEAQESAEDQALVSVRFGETQPRGPLNGYAPDSVLSAPLGPSACRGGWHQVESPSADGGRTGSERRCWVVGRRRIVTQPSPSPVGYLTNFRDEDGHDPMNSPSTGIRRRPVRIPARPESTAHGPEY